MFTIFSNVYALEVSKSDLTLERGSSENIELYLNTDYDIISVTFTMVFSTYDIPADFQPVSGATDTNPFGITHTVIFDEAKTGKVTIGYVGVSVKYNGSDTVGSVNIHTGSAKTTSGDTIYLDNKNINITVGTPVEEPKEEPKDDDTDKNLLDKIESNIVIINLKPNQYEYTIKIDETVDELDLKAIPKDENTQIDITSQKLTELEENKITITAKNGDTEQKYIINIETKEDAIVIDNEEFKEDKSYKAKWIVVSILLIVALLASMLLSRKK